METCQQRDSGFVTLVGKRCLERDPARDTHRKGRPGWDAGVWAGKVGTGGPSGVSPAKSSYKSCKSTDLAAVEWGGALE